MAEIIENSIEDFTQRFAKLSEEAYGFGIDSVVILSQDSILEGSTSFRNMCTGNFYTCIGMVHCMLRTLTKSYDSIDDGLD